MQNSRGFSLIEMSLVLVLIGVLAVLVVPTVLETSKTSQLQRAEQGLESLRKSVVGFALQNNALPESDEDFMNRLDPWQRRFDYYFAQSGGNPVAIDCISAPTADLLQVNLPSGETVQNVAFILRSVGPRYADANNYAAPAAGVFTVSGDQDDLFTFMTYYQLVRTVCRNR